MNASADGFELDEQDRIAILQMLTLTPSQRVAYLIDEVNVDGELRPIRVDE
jgi:hypothetical protein